MFLGSRCHADRAMKCACRITWQNLVLKCCWGTAMSKQCLALFLLLITPLGAMPQRYGRPYSLAEQPQILLQIRFANKSRYFRGSDLRRMQRSVVTQTDSTTKASHVYEGVTLEQLAPSTDLALQGGSIEIEFGSHQTLTLSGIDLAAERKLIIIDTVDGKPLSGHVPFYVFAKSGDKPITDVQCITVKLSR